MAKEEKKWYQSKTKVSAVLIGLSAVFGTVAGIIIGNIPVIVGLQTIVVEAGMILGVFGLRDLPFVNKK